MGMVGDVCDQPDTERIHRLPFDAAECAYCVRTTCHPRESQDSGQYIAGRKRQESRYRWDLAPGSDIRLLWWHLFGHIQKFGRRTPERLPPILLLIHTLPSRPESQRQSHDRTLSLIITPSLDPVVGKESTPMVKG